MTRARKNGILVNLNYNDLENIPLDFPPEAHTHEIVDIAGLQLALDGKSDTDHKHDGDYDSKGTAAAEISSHESTYNHGNIHEPGSDNETAESIASIHSSVAEDETTDTDTFNLVKSATGALKKITWSSIKSTLKTYFDNIYSTFSGSWNDLADKPSVFPPDTHSHSELHSHANKVDLDNYDPSTFASAVHNHDGDYSKLGHNHDSRYYTESEIDTRLSEKSDSGHTHSDLHNHANKSDLDNYDPASFAAVGHNHDTRYYIESEIDTKLSGKSDSNHNHDSRYYTESEIDTKLSGKADSTHSHSQLHSHPNKSDLDNYDPANFLGANAKAVDSDKLDGNHASAFALSGHNHSGTYEPAFPKNNAFNKNFGTASGTVCQGNDSRLFNQRVPTDDSVTYAKVDSTLKNRVTDNDGAWNFDNGIIDAAISANTTVSFSNIRQNKTLKVKVVISNSATITFPSECTILDGSAEMSGNDGTYYVYFDAWSTSEILVSIAKGAT